VRGETFLAAERDVHFPSALCPITRIHAEQKLRWRNGGLVYGTSPGEVVLSNSRLWQRDRGQGIPHFSLYVNEQLVRSWSKVLEVR
jgi:cyanophycinase-like exopeptidase